ncbi:MAG: NADP-dependent oxidoreductase [Chloroflexota bacterium]
MRAVAFAEFGGPEVLTVADLPAPEPGPGEIRVRVAAATVNPTDTGMRSGSSAAVLRALAKPYVAGMELAGRVDAVGPGAAWKVGDAVLAIVLPTSTGRGAQAEQVVIPADSAAAIPLSVDVVAAATLPMNGLTARRALDLMGLKRGQVLAVTGAAGAVGGYAMQLAVLDGLRVIAEAAPKDEALVRQLGASDVVPRGPGAAAAIRKLVPDGVDGLVDTALLGVRILAAVKDGGHMAVVRGFEFEGEPERGITIDRVRVSDYAHNQAALAGLARLAGEGKLTLRVAEQFRPEAAAEAHRRLAAGGTRGRLVIVF